MGNSKSTTIPKKNVPITKNPPIFWDDPTIVLFAYAAISTNRQAFVRKICLPNYVDSVAPMVCVDVKVSNIIPLITNYSFPSSTPIHLGNDTAHKNDKARRIYTIQATISQFQNNTCQKRHNAIGIHKFAVPLKIFNNVNNDNDVRWVLEILDPTLSDSELTAGVRHQLVINYNNQDCINLFQDLLSQRHLLLVCVSKLLENVPSDIRNLIFNYCYTSHI